MRRTGFLALLAAAALASCGGGTAAPARSGACRIAALGTCAEYPDGSPPGFELGCASGGGTMVASCPVEGQLGTCVFTVPAGPGGSLITASETFYPGLLATPAEAADTCASLDGTFTAGTAQAGTATEQAFSCDRRPVDGTCSDYTGLWEPERRAAFEWICATGDGGALLPPGTSCPPDGRTGTCRMAIGALTRIEEVRHYDPATAAADAAACPFGWTAG